MKSRMSDLISNYQTKQVLIIDNQPVCREGMTAILAAENLSVYGASSSVSDALALLEKSCPDLIITDITLTDGNGIDFIKSAKSICKNVNILVFTSLDETIYAERAIQAGAKGYVMKQAPISEFVEALKKVFSGKVHLSPAMTERMLLRKSEGVRSEVSSIDTLSDRELEVFQMIGEGKPTLEIARCLHLSIKTIETYRAKIKFKLNLSNNIELITHAFEWRQNAQMCKVA